MAKGTSLPVGVGLDLGTSAVRCLIGMQEPDSPAPSIIGFGESPNKGVRKGVVVDIAETVSAITTAVDEAVRIAGVNIDRASVGVNGNHIVSVNSHGIIAIGSGNREITEPDTRRVEEAATVIQLPPNRETIQAFSRNYQIDGQEQVKDPVGMNGMRLEVDTCLVTAATPFIKNIGRACDQAGINVESFITNSLAAADVLIDDLHKEKGTMLMDVGVSTTNLAIFEDNDLLHVAVLPVGSGHITNDLAIGLRTEIGTAETVKIKHVDADPKRISRREDSNIKTRTLNGEFILMSKSEINNIASARLEEIFDLADEELKKINRSGMLPGGVFLTGGGSKLTNIAEFAKQALRLPAVVAQPHGLTGVVDKVTDPIYSTAVGLMVENLRAADSGHRSGDSLQKITTSVGSVIKKVINRIRK